MRALAITVLIAALGADPPATKERDSKNENIGGPPPLLLLSEPSIQRELKLTSEQIDNVRSAATKQKRAAQALREVQGEARQDRVREMMQEDKKLMKQILQADQLKRFRQILLQEQGAPAFGNPRIVRELNMSDEQEQKVEDLLDSASRKMRSILGAGPSDAARAKADDLDKETTSNILDVLTPEQKMKWKELIGEPFKGEIHVQKPSPAGR